MKLLNLTSHDLIQEYFLDALAWYGTINRQKQNRAVLWQRGKKH